MESERKHNLSWQIIIILMFLVIEEQFTNGLKQLMLVTENTLFRDVATLSCVGGCRC